MDFNRTETRALLLGTGLLLLGAAARLGFTPGPADLQWRGSVPAGGSSRTLTETRRRVEARLRDEERASKPLEAGERINPNTASEVELRRLPGVGPTRASAIVAERLAGGPFQHLEDLTRVPGIGPATIASLAPALTLPPRGGAFSGAAGRRPAPRTSLIDVNRAQINELEQITGVGPVLAARIVEVRRRIGRFRGPEDLLHVPGIGPGILQRIRGEVRF
jgi:competence protein ComEA